MHYQRLRRGSPAMDAPRLRASEADRFARYYTAGSPDECWNWTGSLASHGYGYLKVKRNGAFIRMKAARWALELKLGRPLTGWALHGCDNRACVNVNPGHVYEGDALLNSQDAISRDRLHRGPKDPGTVARGESSGMAKLTDDAVRSIRRRYAGGGISQQELADEFGVDQTKISDVIRRKTWKHVW